MLIDDDEAGQRLAIVIERNMWVSIDNSYDEFTEYVSKLPCNPA